MSYATIDELRASLGDKSGPAKTPTQAYIEKMHHHFPAWPCVRRHEYVLERVKGKTVLDIGASGDMHAAIATVATKAYGWDRYASPGIEAVDLESLDETWPVHEGVEVVVLGEVLEHLGNPLMLLKGLRVAYPCPTIISVPNAFSEAGRRYALKGIECINPEHCSWYSPWTLTTVVQRAGYRVVDGAYYNRQPIQPAHFAEGLVIVAE